MAHTHLDMQPMFLVFAIIIITYKRKAGFSSSSFVHVAQPRIKTTKNHLLTRGREDIA